MVDDLPTQTSQLTVEWLTAALQGAHPGVELRGARVVGERSSTNHHVRIELDHGHGPALPDTLFCKMASPDPAHRAAIGATGMGAREVRFYNEMAPGLAMRIPACHFAASGPDGAFIILLEDLQATGCITSDGTWGLTTDQAAQGLTDLAHLHVAYEHPDRLTGVAPWITVNPAGNIEFTSMMLRQVIEAHRDILSGPYVAVAEAYLAAPQAVVDLWAHEPHTVVHGDAHFGNMFLDDGRVGFLDWGLMAVAPALRDVSYFISLQLTAAERRVAERDLIAHYLDVRRGLGGTEITADDAWRAHRIHAGYLVLASFLSLVPPYNGPDQREFSDAFRGRAMQAVDDLEADAALRAALG